MKVKCGSLGIGTPFIFNDCDRDDIWMPLRTNSTRITVDNAFVSLKTGMVHLLLGTELVIPVDLDTVVKFPQ